MHICNPFAVVWYSTTIEFTFRGCSSRKQSRSAIWRSLHYGDERETCASFSRSVRKTMAENPMLTANTDSDNDRIGTIETGSLCL